MLAAAEIYSCKDVKSFLQLTLAKLKSNQGKGLKTLAEWSGFRSPSAICMILRGQRRFPLEAAAKLSEVLSLDLSKRSYVLNLVRFEIESDLSEKLKIQEELEELRLRKSSSPIELSQYRALTVWYYPALYALATPGNLILDAEKIAQRLGRQVTARMVQVAVGDLLNLNLLCLENGKLLQKNGPLSTHTTNKQVAIQRYHSEMLRLALQAITLPVETRELSGLTVMIPAQKLSQIKKRIQEFREELSQLLTGSDEGEVYQFNMQLFPLTQTKEGEKC